MATKMVYTCDKCGSEQNHGDQFWTVGVTATMSIYAGDQRVDKFSMQVCRPCLESLGIHVRTETKEKPDHNPPTLEDLIREIVEQTVARN